MAKKRAYAEWGRQPIGPVGIEYDHARAEGLVFFAPLSGAHGTLDLVKKQLGVRTGLEAYLPTQGGALHHLFGTSNYAIYPELPDLSYTTPTTVAWTQEARSTSGYSTVLNIKATGATYAFLIYESGSDANYYFVVGRRENVIGPHTQFNTPAGALTDDRLSRFVLTLPSGFSTGSGARLWRDGVELTGTVSGVGSTFGDNTTADFRIGARDTGADQFEGLIGDLRIWSRVLPDGDAEDESTVPGGWKLYAKSRILVPVSAGGGAYTLTAEQGSYTLTGQAAGLLAGRVLAADQGSYTLSGQDAALLKGSALTADQGSYALTGQDVGLLRGLLLSAAQGSYALSGQDATLTYTPLGAYSLAADQGIYTLTGQSASLLWGPVLAAGQGSYTLNGQDATLTYTPVGAYILTAGQGSYALTGQDVLLQWGHVLAAAQGSYTLTGQAATLARGLVLAAAQGSYTLTGQVAAFARTYVMSAGYGSYALTGQIVSLTYSGAALEALEYLLLISHITQSMSKTSKVTMEVDLISRIQQQLDGSSSI